MFCRAFELCSCCEFGSWVMFLSWLGMLDFLKRLCYTVRELERQSLVLQEESPGSIRHGSR